MEEGKWDLAYAAIRQEAEENQAEVMALVKAIVFRLEEVGITLSITTCAALFAAAVSGAAAVLTKEGLTQQVGEEGSS